MCNEGLGPALLLMSGICLVHEIFLLYYLFVIYQFVRAFGLAGGLISVQILVGNLLNTVQKVHLFKLSQGISSATRRCLLSIQSKRLNENIVIKPSYKLDLLESRLGDREPIRPCDAFALNYSTLCGSYGLLLTFTIVLIQFS